MEEINLGELYQKAFGVKYFDSGQIEKENYLNVGEFDTPKTDEKEFSYFKDARRGATFNGMPVFMPVWLDEVMLPNEPTIDIKIGKNFVKTQLQRFPKWTATGREVDNEYYGTIKEFTGFKDTEITIRGIIINEKSKKAFPEDALFKLHEIVKKNESVTLSSGLTNLLGIRRVVIESMTLPEMVGVQHAQAYEIKCISDRAFEVYQD
jgi:Domain of unknown function (DUF6046)